MLYKSQSIIGITECYNHKQVRFHQDPTLFEKTAPFCIYDVKKLYAEVKSLQIDNTFVRYDPFPVVNDLNQISHL